MKNSIFFVIGMIVAFSMYTFWYSNAKTPITKQEKTLQKPTKETQKKFTTHEKIDKTKQERKKVLIAPSSTKDNTVISSVDTKQQNNETEYDEEIYREELEEAGVKPFISRKTKVKILEMLNTTSSMAATTKVKKMKIKAKEKDGVTKVKAMFTSLMVDKEEAKKKKIAADFITYIVAIVNDKVVFEATTSGFMAENPLLKFSFTGAKKGDTIIFVCKVLNGDYFMGKKKIK